MKRLKFRTVIAAIRKNGYPKIKNQYIDFNPTTGKMIAGCAMGQAAHNLRVPPAYLFDAMSQIDKPYTKYSDSIQRKILYMNDDTDMTLQEIADQLEKDYAEHLDKTVMVMTDG